MSDEEKKAIEDLKDMIEKSKDLMEEEFYKLATIHNIQAVATLLNLIEKQSKEIEELRTQIDEHVYYDLGGRSCGKTELLRHYKKGYDMNNKFWKDKIKAKIEEIKQKQYILSSKDSEIEILQSLLEKE